MAKKKAPKMTPVAVALLAAVSAAVEEGLLTTEQLVSELGLEAPEADEKPAKGKGKKAAKEEAPAKGKKAAKGKGKKAVEEDEDEDDDSDDDEEFDRDEAIARLVEEGDHKKAKLKKMDDEELQALLEELEDSDDDEDDDDSDDDEDDDEDDEDDDSDDDSDDDEDDEDW